MKSLLKSIVTHIITFEARILLKRTRPQIIAIIGSVGKTSVKDAVYAVLKDHVHVRKSEKSFNSEIGVPLSILGLSNAWSSPRKWLKNIIDGAFLALHPGDYPKLLVLEIGVDRPGDMEKLAEWIRPDVVVLTRLPLVPVHVEFFDSPESVIEEKKKMVDALKPDGILIFNHDDENVVAVAEAAPQQSIGYSRSTLSPFTASSDTVVYENGTAVGFEFTLTHLDEVTLMRVNGSLGIQHAYNFAAATAVASLFDISVADSAGSLKNHIPPAGRMRIIAGIKDSLIIDDTYNSSPVASERSLETVKDVKGVKRRIAILGDMMELGQYSVREHERIGELMYGIIDVLITVGVRARGFAKGARLHGMGDKNIIEYDNTKQAAKELDGLIKPGDLILIKGSQSIRAEQLVEEIMAHPEDASSLLVRQDAAWKNVD